VASADIDRDGFLDVVTAGSVEGSVSFFAGLGDGLLGERHDLGVAGTLQALALGDLDGDGDPDLVVLDGSAEASLVFLNQSPPGLRRRGVAPGTSPAWVGAAHPNPFRGETTLDLTLAVAGPACAGAVPDRCARRCSMSAGPAWRNWAWSGGRRGGNG
jgi:hypothetical protein